MSRLIPVSAALAAAVVAAVTLAQPLPAATYPTKPVRLISGAPPGTPADVAARTISDSLAGELGQPVIVENRPGAINTIAMSAVANAPPDGHVLGLLGMVSTVAPSLLAQVPYDTLRDLAPVRQLSSLANVLVVRADAPVESLEALVAAARKERGKLTYASGGNGTPAHLIGELLKRVAGVDLLHVPFKGAPAGVGAVLGGHVDLMFATAPAVTGHVQSGRLRAIVTTAPQRNAAMPEVPTAAELGLPALTVQDWNGVVAPAGTPVATIKRIADALEKALAREDVQRRLTAAGMQPAVVSDPEAFGLLVRSELERWAALVRSAGIRAD